jgi:divalent metal cation (Fe/Co/Zn/Cd) transporter
LEILDPVIAIFVALIIIKAAYDILRKSFGSIVDTGLPDEEQAVIAEIINAHREKLAGFHGLRTRKAGSQRFAELHLVMPRYLSVDEAHRVCDHLEEDLKSRLPMLEITLHVEPCEDENCPLCAVTCPERKTRKKPRRQAG